jgi:putative hemolysin
MGLPGSASAAAAALLQETPLARFAPRIARWLFGELEDGYRQLDTGSHGFFRAALRALAVSVETRFVEGSSFPVSGPAVMICNHPYGLVEPLVLAALLSELRSDFRFVGNSMIGVIPPAARHLIPMDPQRDRPGALAFNRRSVCDCVKWLEQGGLLVLFPAADVACFQWRRQRFADPPWSDLAALLLARTQAPVIPVYFHGRNSLAFHAAGLIHREIRTALLARELLKQRGRAVSLCVGPMELLSFEQRQLGRRQATAWLRQRAERLRTLESLPEGR